MEKREKLEAIQALRALAFIGILCQHCSVARLGTWGVSVFFVLSGFILTFTSLREGRQFSPGIRRGVLFSLFKINKLYLTHVVTTSAVLVLTLYSMYVDGNLNQWPKQLFYLIVNLLLVQDWFRAEAIRCSLNGVAWYLSAMTFLYFIFPFIFPVIKKYKIHKSGVTVLSITYIVQIIITVLMRNTESYFTYFFPVYRCFDFFSGCNMGYLFYCNSISNAAMKVYNEENTKKYTLFEVLGIILVVVAIYVNWNITKGLEWINNSLLYLPSSCVVIYLFACEKGMITRFLRNKILIDIGNISGYAFLIHQTILYYFQAVYYKIFDKYVEPIVQVICVFFLTIVVTKAWVFVCAHFHCKTIHKVTS